MLPYQTLPSSGHVSRGCFCLTPYFYYFLIFFPFKHQHWSQSTRRPNSAAVGLAQAHCAESRAQLAADTQKQNLARPLPPSPQKGDGRAGSLCFCHSNPEHTERAHNQCRLRAEQPLGLALNTAHLHALPLQTQNFAQQAQNHPVAPLEFPAGLSQPLVQTLPARSCTPPIRALLQSPATMSNC